MNNENNSIIKYLLLATIIPTMCAVVFIFIPFIADTPLYLPLFGLQSMAPTLAAIFVIMRNSSKSGLIAFLKKKYIYSVNIKICFFSFTVPMLLMLISKLIVVAFHKSAFEITVPSANKMLIILWALIAEELGWRGFLQEKIEKKIGLNFTPLVIGVIWGLWHFHYFLTGVMDVSFVLLILGCIFESYGYFVITKLANGNIIPASIWHFSGNLFINLFMLNVNEPQGSNLSYLTMTCILSICILGFLFYRHKLTKHNAHYNK